MGDIDILSPFGSHSEYHAQFFNQMGRFKYKIPIDFSFLSRGLKPDKLEGRFKGEIFGFLHTIG